MKKDEVFKAIIEKLQSEFRTLMQASAEARRGAGDEESRADGKYNTQSTEANYLADGQAKQAMAVAVAARAFESLEMRDFGPGDAIGVGALVEVRMMGEEQWFFVGPVSGGLEVTVSGKEITVITPESPLGGQLMGIGVGDRTSAPEAEVLSLC